MNFNQHLDDLGLSPLWLMNTYALPAALVRTYVELEKTPPVNVLKAIAHLRVVRDFKIKKMTREYIRSASSKFIYMITYENTSELAMFEQDFQSFPIEFYSKILSASGHEMSKIGYTIAYQPMVTVEYLNYLGKDLKDTFDNKVAWSTLINHQQIKLVS